MIEALGYFATALNVAGNLMLARMSLWGWVVRLLTNVTYIVYALQIDQGLPVVANHVVFIGINVYGYWQWRKQLPKPKLKPKIVSHYEELAPIPRPETLNEHIDLILEWFDIEDSVKA